MRVVFLDETDPVSEALGRLATETSDLSIDSFGGSEAPRQAGAGPLGPLRALPSSEDVFGLEDVSLLIDSRTRLSRARATGPWATPVRGVPPFNNAGPRIPVVVMQVGENRGRGLPPLAAPVWTIPEPYGPGCAYRGRLTALIEARLRGRQLDLEADQTVTMILLEDLVHPLVELASLAVSGRLHELGPVIRTPGIEVSLTELSAKIAQLLPTCYRGARTSTRRASLKPATSTLPHLSAPDSSPIERRAASPPQLQELASTVDFWRTRIQLNADIMTSRAQGGIGGGSIAVVTEDSYLGTITKTARAEGFEGAGRAKLLAEIDFYQNLEDPRHADLRALYAQLHSYDRDDACPSLTLYVHGDMTSLGERIAKDGQIQLAELWAFVEQVFAASYFSNIHTVSPSAGLEMLDRVYVTRAQSRIMNALRMLESGPNQGLHKFARNFQEGKALIVEDREVPNPLRLLDDALHNARLRDILRVRTIGRCGHGDMTTLNIIGPISDLRLVDPRGVIGDWDPAYDLAKIAFSLTGYSHIIHCPPPGPSSAGTVQSALACTGDPGIHATGADFYAQVADAIWLDTFRQREPMLTVWVRFGGTGNYLADARYRFVRARDGRRCVANLIKGALRLSDFWSDA